MPFRQVVANHPLLYALPSSPLNGPVRGCRAMLCTVTTIQIQNFSSPQKKISFLLSRYPQFPFQPLTTIRPLSVCMDLSIVHINGIIQYATYCDWLLPFSQLNILGSIPVVACVRTSFPLMAESHSIVWLDPVLLIHSSIDGHLDRFPLLAVINSAV